ncbi:putative (R)-mandelonitrile lyase [Helianthus anomalus]
MSELLEVHNLLLSGLGPSSYLSSLNMAVVLDHPFIGQFMADHQRTEVNLLLPEAINRGRNACGWVTDSGPYIEWMLIPPKTPLTSFLPSVGSHPPLNSTVQIIAGEVTRPISTGSLHLLSASNVTAIPSVRFNYYNHTENIHQCWNVVLVIRKLLGTPTWESTSLADKVLDSLGRNYLRTHPIMRPLRGSVVELWPHFGISTVDACLTR